MKNLKKALVLAGLLTLAAATLVGCGGSDSSEDKTITVGASPSPHAEILEAARPVLKEEGYELKIVEFEDYVKPNEALADGDIDANYFQHEPYLKDYVEKNDVDLVSAGAIHYEPLGIYKGTKSSLEDLTEGDKIGVPNDPTNEARALLLLQTQGIIELSDGAGLDATKNDIVSNPKGVVIEELEAAILPKSLPDLAFAVINGNYALSGGLTSADAICYESGDSEAAATYANIVAVRGDDIDSDKTKALVKALKSDTVKDYIEKNYDGAVVAVE